MLCTSYHSYIITKLLYLPRLSSTNERQAARYDCLMFLSLIRRLSAPFPTTYHSHSIIALYAAKTEAYLMGAGTTTTGDRSISPTARNPTATEDPSTVRPTEYRDTCTPRHVAARLPPSSSVSRPPKRSMRARHVTRAKK